MGRLHTPFDAVELASDAVARGNRKVFEEIGYEFARWLADPEPDFLDGLRPGDPPDGQRLLAHGVHAATRRRRSARSSCSTPTS